MQNLYENFLHENFYTRSNYSNRAIINVNYTKIFLHENFLHENKANYGSGDGKDINNRHVQFGSFTGSGKDCDRHCTFMAPHRKCMVKILIGCKYCVRHLNEKIFSGSSSAANEPNFKIMCCCIHELLNVFEDPAIL